MLKKGSGFLLVFSLVVLFTSIGLAQGIEVGGELSQILNYGLEEEELTGAITNYKLEFEKDFGFTGKLYLSLKGDYDFLDQVGSIGLDEAYAAVYLDRTDLTIGRQVINWGTADGINPTNSINPLTPDSFTEGELSGKPLLALQATYYGTDYDLTGVVIPEFVPVSFDNYSALRKNEEFESIFDGLDITLPENKLENMEYALKYGTLVGGYDLRLSYFHGWEDVPALITRMNIDPETQQPDRSTQTYDAWYRKVNKLGIATAGVLNEYGVWAEAAYVIPEELDLASENPLEIVASLSMNEPYLQAVIGGDYTLENGIYSELQYLYYGNGSLIMPYNLNPGEEPNAGHYLMNRISYDIDQDNLLELTGITRLNDGSAIIIPTYTYRLNQVTDLKISPILPVGDDGEFTDFPQQVSVSVKTSF
jgi:hypothetical protein